MNHWIKNTKDNFAFRSCRRSVSDQNVEALGKYNIGEQEGCTKNV